MSWPRKKVSELCIFAVDCINKTAPTVDNETKYKMIRTTNVKDGFVYLDHVSYVTEETFLKWTRRSRPQYGDVILTREAPVGQVGRFTYSDENVFLGQRLFHYRPNPALLDWNFLAYVLMSREVQGRLQGMGFGATVNHIRVGDAEHLEIPCPPTRIQRKIGSILSSYDDLIENNRRRIQLLEESARMLYKEWFVRLRFPGHEHVKVMDGVPEGWERKKASELIEINPKTTIDTSKKIKYFPMSALATNGMTISLGEIEYRKKATNVHFGYADTLFARITPCLENGKTAICLWIEENETACGSTEFIILRGKMVSPWFTYIFSRQEEFRALAIASMVGTSGRQRVHLSCFDRFYIIIPPKQILDNFDDIVQPLFAQIQKLVLQNRKLAQARDLLLPKLMNGEVAV